MRTFVVVLLVLAGLWIVADPGPGLPRADFVLGNGGEPRSLDPALATPLAEGRIARALFEGLVRLEGPDLKVAPAAAESFTVSDAGDVFRFTIRRGARWSDGVPVTAGHFRDGLLRLLDPDVGSRSAAYLFEIAGARTYYQAKLKGAVGDPSTVGVIAVDAGTLEIRTNGPAPALLPTLAAPSLAPIRLDLIAADPGRWTHPEKLVSNGPFRLVYRSVRDRIRLARNPFYWDDAKTGFSTVDVLALDAQTTLVNLYFAGEVDWLTDVPTALLREIATKHPEHLRTAPLYGTYFFRVNTRLKPFGNAKVRRALDLAVDKQGIVDALLAGGERPAKSIVPPLVGEPPAFVRDVALARRLMAEGLAEEGLSKLPAFELSCSAVPLHQAVCELLQIQWRDAYGTEAGLARMEAQAFFAAVESGDYALARGSWIGDYPDPLTFLDVFVGSDPNNQTGFSDPQYDRLVREDLRRTADPARRAAIAAEAARLLDAAMPAIPIFHYASVNLIRPEIKGFEVNALDLHPLHRLGR